MSLYDALILLIYYLDRLSSEASNMVVLFPSPHFHMVTCLESFCDLGAAPLDERRNDAELDYGPHAGFSAVRKPAFEQCKGFVGCGHGPLE